MFSCEGYISTLSQCTRYVCAISHCAHCANNITFYRLFWRWALRRWS